MYHVESMTNGYANEISGWTYPGEYAIYSFQENRDTVDELMNGAYFACVDGQEDLIGYFCYGKSAQIPTIEDNVYGMGLLDIGLGLKPELCGKGLGAAFMESGMEYARKNLGAAGFRLTVALFNSRAGKVYKKIGFEILAEVTHKNSHRKFFVMGCK
jgi:RimJ/RimL family protein N-acetyltransferase